MWCLHCKHEIADEAKACPVCGEPTATETTTGWRLIFWLLIFVVLAVGGAAAIDHYDVKWTDIF